MINKSIFIATLFFAAMHGAQESATDAIPAAPVIAEGTRWRLFTLKGGSPDGFTCVELTGSELKLKNLFVGSDTIKIRPGCNPEGLYKVARVQTETLTKDMIDILEAYLGGHVIDLQLIPVNTGEL